MNVSMIAIGFTESSNGVACHSPNWANVEKQIGAESWRDRSQKKTNLQQVFRNGLNNFKYFPYGERFLPNGEKVFF